MGNGTGAFTSAQRASSTHRRTHRALCVAHPPSLTGPCLIEIPPVLRLLKQTRSTCNVVRCCRPEWLLISRSTRSHCMSLWRRRNRRHQRTPRWRSYARGPRPSLRLRGCADCRAAGGSRLGSSGRNSRGVWRAQRLWPRSRVQEKKPQRSIATRDYSARFNGRRALERSCSKKALRSRKGAPPAALAIAAECRRATGALSAQVAVTVGACRPAHR